MNCGRGCRGRNKAVVEQYPKWPESEAALEDLVAFFTDHTVAVSIVLCTIVLLLDFKKTRAFLKEFLGVIVMVILTMSPGPFLGHLKGYEVWLAHMIGVVVADFTCGSPDVNPAVSTANLVYKKISLLDLMVRIAAQVAGGIIAFPLLQFLSTPYKLKITGPGIQPGVELPEAVWSEGVSTFLLVLGIFAFATTSIGKVYIIKQPLIAAVLRSCYEFFGKTGPAINPMLATTWAFYDSGFVWPGSHSHFAVYWAAPIVGAAVATLLWSFVTSTGPFNLHTSVEGAWQHSQQAAKTIDRKKFLLDFTEDSTIEVFTNSVLGDSTLLNGLAQISEAFKNGLLVAEFETQGVEKAVIDEATRTVFYAWDWTPKAGWQTYHGSKSTIFDENFRIIRQHIMSMRTVDAALFLIQVVKPRVKLRKPNWDLGVPVEKWDGVEFDKDGNVTQVRWRNWDLRISLKELEPIITKKLARFDIADNTNLTGDVAVFHGTEALKVVHMQQTKVKGDISAFQSSRGIEDVILARTYVSGDIAVFKNMSDLQQASLNKCQDVDGNLSIFEECPKLVRLGLDSTQVSGDISLHSVHASLQVISLRGTKVSGDFKVLAGSAPDIRKIDLKDTACHGDVESFMKCLKLTDLQLKGIKSIGDVAKLKEEHPNRNLTVTADEPPRSPSSSTKDISEKK